MNRQVRADLMLLIITIFWGASYILTKVGLETLQPFNLTAIRFIIAFCISAVVFNTHIFRSDINTIKYALILAIILFSVFISMTFGLKYTSASNAGFLISLSVVLTPIISHIFLKQKIEKKICVCVCLALIGIALMTVKTQLIINSGNLLCIVCAFLFAIHIVVTGIFTQNVDSIALGVLQLGFVGLFSTVFSLLTETMKLPYNISSWFVVLSLSIFCTAIGYIIQTTAQQHTSATHTALILSLEPVFSAIFAYFFLGEIFSPKEYVGAFILMFSVIMAELDFKDTELYPTKSGRNYD